LYFFKRILFEIQECKGQQKLIFEEIAASIKEIKKDFYLECQYKKTKGKEFDLKQFGIKPEDIDNNQGKTISANHVKRILKQLNPDCTPEQLLRQLREKIIIKPFKSKFSSKFSGKYYLASIIDYIKSQQNSFTPNRQQGD